MLNVNNISFSYSGKPVLDKVSFSIGKGQIVALAGESGCGKSTLLKLIYGIYDLNEGTISYGNKLILGPKFNLIAGEDHIKYLAQDFDLMPFISVAENIGKFLSNSNKTKKFARIEELLQLIDMQDFTNVMAKTLSGGQQQRVALAKVLALEPELLLLDEPFSQIDNFKKNSLRRNLFSYLKEKQITCLIATHDTADILSFADEAIIFKDGKMIRKGSPKDIYDNPESLYTASLFGEVNAIPRRFFESYVGDELTLVYPHQLKITQHDGIKLKVVRSYFKGDTYLIEAVYDGDKVLFFQNKEYLPSGIRVSVKKIALHG